jgi:hypothetical protein
MIAGRKDGAKGKDATMRLRDLVIGAMGLAMVWAAWPYLGRMPVLSSIFGGTTRTMTLDPGVERAMPR